jgi:hypothetical protein
MNKQTAEAAATATTTTTYHPPRDGIVRSTHDPCQPLNRALFKCSGVVAGIHAVHHHCDLQRRHVTDLWSAKTKLVVTMIAA